MMRLPSHWKPATGRMSFRSGNVKVKHFQSKARICFSTMEKGRERKLGCPKNQAKGADGESMELQAAYAPGPMKVSIEN